MPVHELSPGNALYYEHTPPEGEGGRTFVFFNLLTTDITLWTAGILPGLREAGHGALVYNMRGQPDSPFTPGTALDEKLIVGDALSLLEAQQPVRPIFVGGSIGGLYAMRAHLSGHPADGLVLINTLREGGTRLSWINAAVVRMMEVGGPQLLGDVLSPHIWGPAWLENIRPNFLGSEPYVPLDKASGHYSLLANADKGDWDIPYEEIAVPVLVLSGPRDRIFFDEEVVARLTGRMPKAQRVDVPHGGHILAAEHPEITTKAMVDFAAGF